MVTHKERMHVIREKAATVRGLTYSVTLAAEKGDLAKAYEAAELAQHAAFDLKQLFSPEVPAKSAPVVRAVKVVYNDYTDMIKRTDDGSDPLVPEP